MSLRLRPLRYDDLAAVLDLERSLFPDDAWSPGMFAEELAMQGRGRHYVAAEEGNKLVGYAGMMLPGGRQAEVLTLAVGRAHWGRGIGTTLLTDLLDEAGRHDCTEMVLEVRADNPRAQNLYRRFGFSDAGIRRGYYQPSGMDAIVMRCGLGEPALPKSAEPAKPAEPTGSAGPPDSTVPPDSAGPAGGAAPDSAGLAGGAAPAADAR